MKKPLIGFAKFDAKVDELKKKRNINKIQELPPNVYRLSDYRKNKKDKKYE